MAEPPVTTRTGARAPADAREPVSAKPAARERDRLAQDLLEGRGWTLLRLASDGVLLLLAALSAQVGAEAANLRLEAPGAWTLWLFPPAALALLALRGAYARKLNVQLLDGLGRLVGATSLAAMAILTATVILDHGARPEAFLARVWFFGTAYLLGGRVLLGPDPAPSPGERDRRQADPDRRSRPRSAPRSSGASSTSPSSGCGPSATWTPTRLRPRTFPTATLPVLGGPDELERGGRARPARSTSSSPSCPAPDRVLVPLVRECEARGLEISLVPRLFEQHQRADQRSSTSAGCRCSACARSTRRAGSSPSSTRSTRAAASLLLILLAPLLLAIAARGQALLAGPGPLPAAPRSAATAASSTCSSSARCG